MYFGEDTDDTQKGNNIMDPKIIDGEEETAQPKRALDAADAGGEQKVSAKFLLSNASAGSVIGKSGVTITEFQAQSGARIQLSRNREFFPGTTDRILLLTGTVNAILTALHLILSKLLTEEPAGQQALTTVAPSTIVKLVVPSAVCGGIIGKGGSTIRSYVEDSGAHIKLSGVDAMLPGVHERIITITGTLEQQLRAVALIITKMADDPNFPIHSSVLLSYPHITASSMQNAIQPQSHANMSAMNSGPTTTVTVAIPDEHIGAVVGRGGKYITEMQQVSGVRIKISDRNDFVPGTRNRKVTLTGSLEAVQIAQFLISQKVQVSATELQNAPRQPQQ